MIGQSEPGHRVETRAVRPAHRLERQCQHHRISDERFKIHVVVLNLILESFPRMIREKLLELDFDGLEVNMQVVARDHARWFSGIVGELTEAQVRQAFETAGATPEEVNGFSAVIMRRIAALKDAVK